VAFVLLDSTVLIDYLRGRPVVDRVDGLERVGDTPITTAVNVEEVVRGLKPSEAEDAASLFLGLEIASMGRAEGWQAGAWRREYAGRGVTLSQADCLVAATASTRGATLATGNPRHFPMQEIVVEHWPVGE
jgi:predicted nucleic acid-binding protein